MWYAIASYDAGAGTRAALVIDEKLYDLEQAAAAAAVSLPSLALGALLEDWSANEERLRRIAAAIPGLSLKEVAANSYRLQVPFQPGRIFATASNFYDHAREMGTELAPRSESTPYCFMKADSSVTATGTDVVMPVTTAALDWEVELAVVIGRRCKNVPIEKAYDVIAGYTVFNDISARDLNRRTDYPFKHDWFRGKSFDTFGPMGPWMVPRDCIADPQKLRMQLAVNGETMQDGTGEAMIFNIAEQIAYLTGILTLQPGDMIATGTPNGVGMGRGIYLKPGDEMVANIESIGALRNRVVLAAA